MAAPGQYVHNVLVKSSDNTILRVDCDITVTTEAIKAKENKSFFMFPFLMVKI
jgi:hypothetical protein